MGFLRPGGPQSELCFAAVAEAIRWHLIVMGDWTHRAYPPHDQIKSAEDRLERLVRILEAAKPASVNVTLEARAEKERRT